LEQAVVRKTPNVAPVEGKLGVLTPGMGAVTTTFIAGVESIKKGLALPIGSLTQMGHVRLGKRTDERNPLIRELVPLATLNDLVFGGWDIYEDNCYDAAVNAKVLSREQLDGVKDEMTAVTPMPAVFEHRYVTRIDGPNIKKQTNKKELAEALIEDIRQLRKRRAPPGLSWSGADRLRSSRRPGRLTRV
jgi:myo-inositol-1-phosphate synthase